MLDKKDIKIKIAGVLREINQTEYDEKRTELQQIQDRIKKLQAESADYNKRCKSAEDDRALEQIIMKEEAAEIERWDEIHNLSEQETGLADSNFEEYYKENLKKIVAISESTNNADMLAGLSDYLQKIDAQVAYLELKKAHIMKFSAFDPENSAKQQIELDEETKKWKHWLNDLVDLKLSFEEIIREDTGLNRR